MKQGALQVILKCRRKTDVHVQFLEVWLLYKPCHPNCLSGENEMTKGK